MQEVQVLGRGLEREGIDRDVALPQAELDIAAVEQGGELPVAVAQSRR